MKDQKYIPKRSHLGKTWTLCLSLSCTHVASTPYCDLKKSEQQIQTRSLYGRNSARPLT